MESKYNEIEILLVEDNAYDAELIMRALHKVNLANNLVHVKDGVEAIEFLFNENEHKNPKVILLDIKMPRLDGIEVLRRLRLNNKTKLVPVVIMTSSKEEQDIIKSYELGVNSYIVKPVEFNNFSKAISELGLYWVLVNISPNTLNT